MIAATPAGIRRYGETTVEYSAEDGDVVYIAIEPLPCVDVDDVGALLKLLDRLREYREVFNTPVNDARHASTTPERKPVILAGGRVGRGAG